MGKRNCLGIFAIVLGFGMMIALFFSCSTSPRTNYNDNFNLTEAIERSALDITARVPANTRIALFNISSNEYSFLAEYAIEEISVILVTEANLIVLDRNNLDVIAEEQRFQLSGNVRDEDIISLGKIHGASVVVSCAVTGEGDFRRLRVRALDVETGRILSLTSHAIIGFDGITRIEAPLQQQTILSQMHGLLIERVGEINAGFFPLDNFTWNDSNKTLTFTSRTRSFTGTDWGIIHSPITFYKEMEVKFQDEKIVGAQWRYVYISADPWFQLGNPSQANPIRSNWFGTGTPNHGVAETDISRVINTLVQFEMLQVNSTYSFRRGGGSNTTLTVRL